jgi:hypothetical protein
MRNALLAIGLLACSGKSSGTPADAALDAAPFDAAPFDAAPFDAAPFDAAPAGIAVHVIDKGVAVANAPVLFHDPSGALIARTTTDAAGDAIGDVPDGSMVTVVATGSGARSWLRTIRGAKRGDRLVFGATHGFISSDYGTVALPAYPSLPSSYSYATSSACLVGDSGANGPSTIPVNRFACEPPSHAPIMGFIVASAPGKPFDIFGWIEQADVALAPNTTITVTGTWQPAVTQQVKVTGVSAGEDIAIRKTWYRNGVPYFGMGRTFQSATTTYPGAGGGDAWRAQFVLCRQNYPAACQFWYRWLTDPLDLSGDVASSRLPWLSDAVVTFGARTTVEWTADAVPTSTYTKVWVDQQDDVNVVAEWTTYLPAVDQMSGSITLPELPADLAARWIGLPEATAMPTATVELDRTVSLTYDQLRGRLFSEDLTEQELLQTSVSRQPWSEQLP